MEASRGLDRSSRDLEGAKRVSAGTRGSRGRDGGDLAISPRRVIPDCSLSWLHGSTRDYPVRRQCVEGICTPLFSPRLSGK
mmetsp:Transcript_10440/g.21042  ORF Transcript_10440/g.21042 Transcript_10440/m.21042 type:complete len:81 (-) Transcript_10440:77-319(-)